MAKWWAKSWWTKKRIKVAAYIGGGLVGGIVAGFIIWYSIPMPAEQKQLQAARNMQTVKFIDTGSAIVLKPAITVTKGILLYPGGRVAPEAYAYKMGDVAQSGAVVVIPKVPLHLAIFDYKNTRSYTDLVPSVTDWYLAGHSLGGVKACQVAGADKGAQFKGLILLAAYCSDSITAANMPVLSIRGSNDKLTTQAAVDAHKQLLPGNTTFAVIDGLNHAGFGDYGVQGGDGEMTVADASARQQIGALISKFIGNPHE